MSEEKYIVWVVDGEFFVDKKNNRADFFLNDSANDGESRIDGKLGDCFFSSVEEAREFCTKRAVMDEFLQKIDFADALEEINFEVCKVGDVLTAQTIKKGKVVSEYSYFESIEDSVDSFSVNLKNDFEDRLLETVLDISEARGISRWILENSDLVMKYIQDNTK